MKAFRIVEAGRTEIVDVAVPEPGSEEVLLRVNVVGYCGSDLNTYRGKNPMVTLPRIPGHEVAATIEVAGAAVPPPWRPGQLVTLSPYTSCGRCPACLRQRPNACQFNQTMGVQRDGALTEYVAVPWQKLYRSEKLAAREFALVEPLTVGFHAAARGAVAKGDVVAVFGCGAIGLGAIAGAAWRQAEVIAIDIDDAKLAVARRAGAAHTVNSASADLHKALGALAPGGPDVAIEAVGLPATFRAAVEEAAFTGRVVYIGYAKEPVAYETRLFVQKELDIRGSRNALPEDFRAVIGMLEAGRFPVDDVITCTVPLAGAGEALRRWSENPAAFMKILVQVTE